MELLFAALGNAARLAIVQHLLGVAEEPRVAPREATQASLRDDLRIEHRGTLAKSLKKLAGANLVTTSQGERADQLVYRLRQPEKMTDLLGRAAILDAAITDELATLHRVEAEMKADVARRLSSAQ